MNKRFRIKFFDHKIQKAREKLVIGIDMMRKVVQELRRWGFRILKIVTLSNIPPTGPGRLKERTKRRSGHRSAYCGCAP